MAREWVINGYDGYPGLVLQDCELGTAGPGEVRLRIEAFALNWGDMDLMLDRYSFSFPRFPARIGMEATGIVDQVGPGVEGITVGQRYCTLPYFYDNAGTSADFAVVDARYITPAPEGLSAVEAASVWMQYMTAFYPVIDISKAGPGTNILATAGTSTAGTAALQLGRMAGATMITTTRFAANEGYLRANGADHVIVTGEDTNIAAAIHAATERGRRACRFRSRGAGHDRPLQPGAGQGRHDLLLRHPRRGVSAVADRRHVSGQCDLPPLFAV